MHFPQNERSNEPVDGEEQILWAGKPSGKVMLTRADRFYIPFGLFWFVLCGYMLWQMFKGNAPSFYHILIAPLTFIGLYYTIGRLFIEAARRRNTAYFITKYRVIIRVANIKPGTQSLNIKNIPAITYKQKKDGSGTITLGRVKPLAAMFFLADKSGRPPQLDAIPEVKKAYDLLVKLQKNLLN